MATVLYLWDEPRTIYECMWFLLRQQFTLCCSSLWMLGGRYVSNRWTVLCSGGCGILAVLGLWYAIYASLTNPVQSARIHALDNLLLLIVALELVMSTFMFAVTLTSMQRHAKRYIAIIDRIAVIDEQLVRDFGARLNYHKLLRKNVLVMTLVAFIYISAVITAIVHLAVDDLLVIFVGACCYVILTGGPHFSGYVHMNMAEVVRIRFRLLSQLLNRELLERRFADWSLRERRLVSAVQLVRELHLIILEIDYVYMPSLVSALAHDFSLTTSELYLLFGRSLSAMDSSMLLLIFVGLCMLPPFYKIIMAPIYCHRTIAEGRKCLKTIERLGDWYPNSGMVRDIVSSLMFWRLEHKIEFHIGVNIVLNKSVLAMILASIVNYLLILIQFRMTQELGDQIEKQKNTLQEWIGIL